MRRRVVFELLMFYTLLATGAVTIILGNGSFFLMAIGITTVVSAGVLPWLPWSNRFSLRTLLIAMTIVAVGLGLTVWMSQ